MNGRLWIGITALFTACAPMAAPPVFPRVVGNVWQLKGVHDIAVSVAPEVVRRIGTRRGWSATYEGPGIATAELYELTAPAGGLEMVQKWRPAADTVVWYTPRYFVVVRWRNTERTAIGALIRALENQFAETK
jgi:hypothetical protein